MRFAYPSRDVTVPGFDALSVVTGVGKLSVSFGFYGKIPARGDFVRSGLPRAFVDAWDGWLQGVMAQSRLALAQGWVPAWMEAPVWRFHLAAGRCGPGAACGLFMPSVDRAGRHFPLTLACVADASEQAVPASLAWLDAAEAAGIEAVAEDLDPEQLAMKLPAPQSDGAQWRVGAGSCAWRTTGSPLVAAVEFETESLPGGAVFARMLRDDAADAESFGE